MAILIIHGGAGTIDEDHRAQYEAGLQAAAEAGYAKLTGPAGHQPNALAAVLAAVTSMESNPHAFNAGVGGALTRDGTAELDACVMLSGAPAGQAAGAVAGITNSPNPILLADLVRRTTPHVLLIGAGAEELVTAPVPNDSLITDKSLEDLRRWKEGTGRDMVERPLEPRGSNTVGAVALDDAGRLAAATSTGGRTGQWRGRVGDAPLPGLGTYADEQVAISCTGKGEAFIQAVTAGKLAAALAAGADLQQAVQRALDDVVAHDGTGGLILVTAEGQVAIGFNTADMAYGIASPSTRVALVSSQATILVQQHG